MPTLPGPLRVNNYAASFPASGRLPAKPNPLSSVTPVAGGKADMQGIEQALVKRAQQFAKVGPGAGRRFQVGVLKLAQDNSFQKSINSANKFLGGFTAPDARELMDTVTGLKQFLKSVVDRNGEFSMAHMALGQDAGNLFTENKAWLLPLLLGGAGAVAQGGVGATIGGIGLPLIYMAMQSPKLMNSMRGVFGRDKVPLPDGAPPATSLKPLPGGAPPATSLSTPPAAASVKLGFQDNKAVRQSAAGEGDGVGYVVNDDNHLTGTKAFGTLDKYMKKAGLNSFQSQFFGRLILEGCTPARRNLLIKHAGAQFGSHVAAELINGLRKLVVLPISEKRSFEMPNLRDPLTAALSGIAVGGLGGGLQGYMDPGYDERGRKRDRMNAAFSSGLIGAGLGGAAGGLGSLGYDYFSPEKPKSPVLPEKPNSPVPPEKPESQVSTKQPLLGLLESWRKAVNGGSDAARALLKPPEKLLAPDNTNRADTASVDPAQPIKTRRYPEAIQDPGDEQIAKSTPGAHETPVVAPFTGLPSKPPVSSNESKNPPKKQRYPVAIQDPGDEQIAKSTPQPLPPQPLLSAEMLAQVRADQATQDARRLSDAKSNKFLQDVIAQRDADRVRQAEFSRYIAEMQKAQVEKSEAARVSQQAFNRQFLSLMPGFGKIQQPPKYRFDINNKAWDALTTTPGFPAPK